MSDLDQVKGLIAQGDKENAVVQLASILLKNKNDLEAWLLMGEIIDDPSRKKDCYNRALRLSPHNLFALMKLQELETAAGGPPIATTTEAETGTQRPLTKPRRTVHFVPNQTLYSPPNKSNDDTEIMSYFLLGVVSVLVILYVIATGSFSNNIFCGGLLFLSISTGIIVLLMINKNRS